MNNLKIAVFVIDPPWPQKKGGLRKVRANQGRELDYQTMSVESIFELLDKEIFPRADTNHCVFLWTIDRFLAESENYMHQHGYRRHCRMIWNKLGGVAPAFTVRFSHEYLLWFYKEQFVPIATQSRGIFSTVFEERSREHSRKPECSYRMIESLYPDALKMDVFSREHRPGWLQYGDQTDHFERIPTKDQRQSSLFPEVEMPLIGRKLHR